MGRADRVRGAAVGGGDALGQPPGPFFEALFPRRKAVVRRPQEVKVSGDVVKVYVSALESITELRRRLERCEKALAHLARRDDLASLIRPDEGRPNDERAARSL